MKIQPQTAQFNSTLLQKYDCATPRYTSYPPATELTTEFNHSEFTSAIARGNKAHSPLSLYFHVPFCQSACYFCGCNVIVTQQKERAVAPYLNYLSKNIESISSLIDLDRRVVQLHWGGGTPNYLNLEQVEILWSKINQHFRFEQEAERSIKT